MVKLDNRGGVREEVAGSYRDHGVPHGGDLPPMRAQQPSFVETMEKHARFWSAFQKIAAGLAALIALLGAVAGVVYKVVSYAAAEQFAIFAARIDPAAVIQTKQEEENAKAAGDGKRKLIAERFAAEATERETLRKALVANTERDTAAEKRADAFDVAARAMFPSRSNRLNLPSLGPTAAAQGRQ